MDGLWCCAGGGRRLGEWADPQGRREAGCEAGDHRQCVRLDTCRAMQVLGTLHFCAYVRASMNNKPDSDSG